MTASPGWVRLGPWFLGGGGPHAEARLLRDALPDKVNRNAGQDNHEAGPGGLGLVQEQDGHDDQRGSYIDDRDPRVSKGTVGALRQGALAAQDEKPSNRKDIEDEDRENHVIQQVAVEVSVEGGTGGGIELDRPGGIAQPRPR